MPKIHACPRSGTKSDGDNGGLGLVIIGDSQGRFNHVGAYNISSSVDRVEWNPSA